MSAKNKPVGRKTDIVVQELDGEVLIYDLKTNKALCLNPTSAAIWNACDGTRDVDQLRQVASESLKAPVDDAMIWLAIDQLQKENLVSDAPDTQEFFGKTSRREVIKRIGLGTAIALPIIASIVAPGALRAASGGLPSGTPSGTASLAGNVCGPGQVAARNTACDTPAGGANLCASNHAQAGGVCNFVPGGNSTFNCVCT